jgi:hypothetical protein
MTDIAGSIFLRTGSGLVELRESTYDSEDILQELIADYPSLVPGDQIDADSPRRLLLIRREMQVPGEKDGAGRWSLDHLFIDQDGVPTLVEVKRSTDSRIRREIVGQMLDYASNAVAYWPIERIRTTFENTCTTTARDPEVVLRDFLQDEETLDRFWPTVETNLQAGRVRMVFVADVIPHELRRIVEFLNQQMSPAEVLALEVKQYVGQNLQTLVPRIIGQTAAAQQRKGPSRANRSWDDTTFFESLTLNRSEAEERVARVLYEWALRLHLRIWWGKGKRFGTFYPMLDLHGSEYRTFSVMSDGRVFIQLHAMTDRPALPDHSYAREMVRQLVAIPGLEVPENAYSASYTFPLQLLTESQHLERFISVFDAYIGHIRAHPHEPGSPGDAPPSKL